MKQGKQPSGLKKIAVIIPESRTGGKILIAL